MISYSNAVNTENIKYIESYECQECSKVKKGTPWVNYDEDNKCICSYLCFKSKKNIEKDFLLVYLNSQTFFQRIFLHF